MAPKASKAAASAPAASPAAPAAAASGPRQLLDLLPKSFPRVEKGNRDDEDFVPGLAPVLRVGILALICLLAFLIRVFSVVKGESQIHEFDPHFNWRATKVLASEGWYDFLNWFDDRVWYPLGRNVGQTVYPGLMYTATILYWALNFINVNINVRNACVFLGPIFGGFTAISTYLFTNQVTRRPSAGLMAAAMVAIVPSYISRSGAGGYDNESVAIFALINTFYLWVKAVDTGSLFWSAAAALSYFYMVASWGGYIFIANMVPIHVLVLLLAGRYSPRLYVAYSSFYALGSILAIQVPFVGFNIVTSAENAAIHGVFIVVQAYALIVFLRDHVAEEALSKLFVFAGLTVVALTFVVSLGLQLSGKIQWTGRSLALLDPTYAKKYLPIIASVSEHQPTTWSSFFFDLQALVPLAPAGLYFLYRGSGKQVSDAEIFTIIYGSVAWYFAGVMVRLMLTLAPIACVLAAVAASELLHKFGGDLVAIKSRARRLPRPIALLGVAIVASLTFFFAIHSAFVAKEAYSSPSIVIYTQTNDGNRFIMDDFREAYYWLRENTHPSSTVMSWWDYGYQTSALANRTTIVDNNTANNTHIACVGRAMASTEEEAYKILTSLDVDYVLVLFGGVAGYSSDDINKFLWMVRIGGGVFPQIQEADYFADGQYRMDAGGAPAMLNSLMYRLSYYRFSEMSVQAGRPAGFDRTRNVEVGVKNILLEHLDEAFTSEHWLVRIYKVRKPANRPNNQHLANRGKVGIGANGKPVTAGQPVMEAYHQQTAPLPKFVGCVGSESVLSNVKSYGGGASGANLRLARHDALTRGKKYFAVARVGGDGHSFSFDELPAKAAFLPNTAGCLRACLDETEYPCGCSDAACAEAGDMPVPPETNNRRWAIYSV